jgi:hypothetical protein
VGPQPFGTQVCCSSRPHIGFLTHREGVVVVVVAHSFSFPDLRKDSWTTDESVEYGGGSAMSPPPPLAAASFQTPQRPTVSEATPLREPPKPRRSTMRMDDGISKLLRRQTIARQSMDASTFRQLLEDSALDSPVGAIAGVDEDSDDDYMNEEDMPEKADKVKDEESMRQLREWLGHAELLEATRSVLW